MNKKIQIALAPGDGSGPEMMRVASQIAIQAAQQDNIDIEFIETPMGWSAYEKYGDTLPSESLEKATQIGTLFFGGVGDPEFDEKIGKHNPDMLPERKCLLTIRKNWNLLLNFRPMIYFKPLAHLAKIKSENIPDDGVEQIFIRFLLEDSYFGTIDLADKFDPDTKNKFGIKQKSEVTGEEAMITEFSYYQKTTVETYFRYAFQYAQQKNLPLISIDKSNVMARYKFWREIATRIGQKEFPAVELKHFYVDAANSMLFEPAKLNGVIACGNEHGDILSDGAAAALGSMGLMASSAINPQTKQAMFESGAGPAPSLKGKHIANPIGRILTGALMLRHIGAKEGAAAIEPAVQQTLQAGWRTQDLFNPQDDQNKILGTTQMGDKIMEIL